ncbi:hypothetical protein LPE509_00146 [Legionella pneumophila subsp. pneumophila LPE509]|nr:hypothetical protein LPE509_00146 [Legionella pneumophila subsp. pneumophila LPE509]
MRIQKQEFILRQSHNEGKSNDNEQSMPHKNDWLLYFKFILSNHPG